MREMTGTAKYLIGLSRGFRGVVFGRVRLLETETRYTLDTVIGGQPKPVAIAGDPMGRIDMITAAVHRYIGWMTHEMGGRIAGVIGIEIAMAIGAPTADTGAITDIR